MSSMASSGGTIPTGGASQASAAPADLACTERQQPQLASIAGKQDYSCVVFGTTMLPCTSSCETVRSISWQRCTLCELESEILCECWSGRGSEGVVLASDARRDDVEDACMRVHKCFLLRVNVPKTEFSGISPRLPHAGLDRTSAMVYLPKSWLFSQSVVRVPIVFPSTGISDRRPLSELKELGRGDHASDSLGQKRRGTGTGTSWGSARMMKMAERTGQAGAVAVGQQRRSGRTRTQQRRSGWQGRSSKRSGMCEGGERWRSWRSSVDSDKEKQRASSGWVTGPRRGEVVGGGDGEVGGGSGDVEATASRRWWRRR